MAAVSKKPRVPRARRVADAKGRIRMVPFNPERADELLYSTGFEQVAESVGFWIQRLSQTACPNCGVVGSLQVEYVNSGILIDCDRYHRVDACNFVWEAHFHGRR